MAKINLDYIESASLSELDDWLKKDVYKDGGVLDEWGFALYKRDPARFEPFFSGYVSQWNLKLGQPEWIKLAKEHGHHRLYCSLEVSRYFEASKVWSKGNAQWKTEFLEALPNFKVFSEDILWWKIFDFENDLFVEIFKHHPQESQNFLMAHYRNGQWRDEYPEELMQIIDPVEFEELYYTIYQHQVPLHQWRSDVLGLLSTGDDKALHDVLMRHQLKGDIEFYRGFVDLAQEGGKRVAPFLLHVSKNDPLSWDHSSWEKLINFADRWADLRLWKAIVQRRIDGGFFNALLKKCLEAKDIEKLMLLRGATTWNGAHGISEEMALLMYRDSPDLVLSFSEHFTPGEYKAGNTFYIDLLHKAIKDNHEKVIELLASKTALSAKGWQNWPSKPDEKLPLYIKSFSAFEESKFLSLVTNVFVDIESSKVKPNLFFAYLLSDPCRFDSVEILSLLESENTYVWNLAFILLSKSTRRNEAILHFNYLSSFLLMRLPRQVYLNLLKAVENAAKNKASAEKVIDQLRLTLELEHRNFTKSHVVKSLGHALFTSPDLQKESESSVIFRRQL